MFPVNQVLHGDCTQVLQRLPDAFVDLVVTDPPYGVRYQDRTHRSIANDDDPSRVLGAFNDVYRLLKPNSLCISFYGWTQVDTFFRAWRAAGFQPVGHIVWVKQYASNARFLRYRHEQAFVLAKGRPPVPSQPLDDIQPWVYSGNVDHPTQKAVRILAPLIEAFTQPGALVLDPFAGSGSTLVAAAVTGRRYLGVELDRSYCEIARNRLARVGDRTPPVVAEHTVAHASFDTEPAVALGGLFQWLRERDYHGLARTVEQAMEHYRT